jgi:hypothetical protein
VLIEQITYVLHPGKAPALVAAYEQQGAARGRSCQAVGVSRLAALRPNLWTFSGKAAKSIGAGPLFTGPGEPR